MVWAVGAAVAVATAVCAMVYLRNSAGSSPPFKSLKGKVVWITGASSGIGRALALKFYDAGAYVVLSSRGEDKLIDVRDECLRSPNPNNAPEPFVLPLDVTRTETLQEKAKEVFDKCGSIDVLINNSGVSQRSAVADTTFATESNIFAVNFLGPVALTKAVLPYMTKAGRGHIVVMSSMQGVVAIPYRAAYSASKHALHGYFDSLRSEVDHDNIHVTLICPGYVRTNLSVNALKGDGSKHGLLDPTTAKGYDPAFIAEETLEAILDDDHTVVIADLKSRVAMYARLLFPAILHMQLLRMAKKGIAARRASLIGR